MARVKKEPANGRAGGESATGRPVAPGRPAQRRRTRRAIIEAAMALLAADEMPSAAEIAAAADVSRRTLYIYFPTLDQLLVDASLGLLSESETNRAIELSGDETDAVGRAVALAGELQSMSPDAERLGRKVIALTVETETPGDGARRGYRRIEWIETAIAPLRAELGAERFERLVTALAMVIGFEARLVARDVRGLDIEAGAEASKWAAAALVRAALEESSIR